eukprot:994313_1
MRVAIRYLRKALDILHDFSVMIRRYKDKYDVDEEDKENKNASFKLNQYTPRIPRTFFGKLSTTTCMDSATNGGGFIQFVVDLRCKTYFELSNAYRHLQDMKQADEVYTEGIDALLNRSNHGQYVEPTPPHSWYQLIQDAIRFYTKKNNERASSIIHNVLTFYQNPEHDVDIRFSTDLLLERSRLLMYKQEHHGAILANEQIKYLRGNENNEEKAMVHTANQNIFVINSILRVKNDLMDTVNFLKINDHSASFYEWIRRINTDMMRVVFYSPHWNVDDEDSNCPAPIDVVFDMMEFAFGCIGLEMNEAQSFEKQLKKVNLSAVLKLIEQWNGALVEEDVDLKSMALRMDKRHAKILIDFLLFGVMAYMNSAPPRYRNAAKLLDKMTHLAQYTKCKEREALLHFKLGECNKRLARYPVALGNLSRAAEIAEKIEHVHMARDIRLTQIEIYDVNENHKSKQDVIELHLETKYNMNATLHFLEQRDSYYTIQCKYEEATRKIQLVLPSNAADDGLDTDSDDDIEIVPNVRVVEAMKKKKPKKSKFEESSDDEDDCEIRSFADSSNSSLRSNSRKRKAEAPLDDAMYSAKRRKLTSDTTSDAEGTITDLQSMNAPIMDLCSDEESQQSEEMDELDHEEVNTYYEGGYQESIDKATHELHKLIRKQIRSDDASSIGRIIKLCECKISIAVTWMEKAQYMKDNEPKSIQNYKMRKHAEAEAIKYAKDIPTDCAPFICRFERGRFTKMNTNHSHLMSIYLASLELFGKYLISRKDWNEAIRKYDEYLAHKLVDYKTVDPLIILHWKYFCSSNIAYSYRQRANTQQCNDRMYKDRCDARDYYKQSASILAQLSAQTNRIAKSKFLSSKVLNASDISRQSAYTNIELGHTLDELMLWRNAIQCYERAAEISRADRENVDQELDAYFDLARTLHSIKDYRRSLHILQSHCRRCVSLCIAGFGSTEFRMIWFDIERWITDILLEKKQMKSAKDTAKKLQYIATHYLSKHRKYAQEADKYTRACQIKSKYESAVKKFEEKTNARGGRASHEERYRCLRRQFELKSYGVNVENKHRYLSLMEHIQNADHALYIRYMMAFAFEAMNQCHYAQPLLLDVFDNPLPRRASKPILHKLIPKCAYSLSQSLTHSSQAIRILLAGFEYIADGDALMVDYLQRLLLLYDTTKTDLSSSDQRKIQQVRNKWKSIVKKRPKHQSAVHSRHRRSHHRNKYHHNNNNNNHKQSLQRTNHSKRYVPSSSFGGQTYRSAIARQMSGLNGTSQASDLKQAIDNMNHILSKGCDSSVAMELMTIRERYKEYLSQLPKQASVVMNQLQLNVNITKTIRNNCVGIVNESFFWVEAPSIHANWVRFNALESAQVEREYCAERKTYEANGYRIQFSHLGNYKLKTYLGNRRRKTLVQRRITLSCLHERKMKGWSALCNRQKAPNHRYPLDADSNRMEYNAICALLKMRGLSGGLSVHRIERIQNIATQMRYNAFAAGGINEFLLFHGTRPANVTGIIEEGTDFRLHGDNGTKYGNGSYFAVYASYAAQFANESQVDVSLGGRIVRYMFLCAVKAGQYCVGSKGLRRPPKGHLSVVDNAQHPSIFVTFDNAMTLPLYLISFSFDA